MNEIQSTIDLASIHNSILMLVRAYGQLLSEYDRRVLFLVAQIKSRDEEIARLRGKLDANHL